MTFEFPVTLKRRGDTVALAIPKWMKDRLRIAADQDAVVRVRQSKNDWIITFRIPRLAKKAS